MTILGGGRFDKKSRGSSKISRVFNLYLNFQIKKQNCDVTKNTRNTRGGGGGKL